MTRRTACASLAALITGMVFDALRARWRPGRCTFVDLGPARPEAGPRERHAALGPILTVAYTLADQPVVDEWHCPADWDGRVEVAHGRSIVRAGKLLVHQEFPRVRA